MAFRPGHSHPGARRRRASFGQHPAPHPGADRPPPLRPSIRGPTIPPGRFVRPNGPWGSRFRPEPTQGPGRWPKGGNGKRPAPLVSWIWPWVTLRPSPFNYTLKPPQLPGADRVDDFLFRTRRGYCEHYASAFTLLMRAAGVPARVVLGYQGGEINPNGNYLIVRQSDAHAWVEALLPGRGWVRVDPTAAVAPERVESGMEAALPQSELQSAWAVRRLGTWYGYYARARLQWDRVNFLWNRWVLDYSHERQKNLLRRLGIPGRFLRQSGLMAGGDFDPGRRGRLFRVVASANFVPAATIRPCGQGVRKVRTADGRGRVAAPPGRRSG